MDQPLSRRRFLVNSGLASTAALTGFGLLNQSNLADKPDNKRPNVLLIMADDLGPEGISCFGSTSIKTPHIDALAANGMKLTQCFATPLCTPTRVQLLTGQYPCHNGWTRNMFTYPVEKQEVDAETYNLAQLFKSAGYRTTIAGKWQLCRFHKAPKHITQMGFDSHLVWTWRITDKANEKKRSRYWQPAIWENGKENKSYAKADIFGPDLYVKHLNETINAKSDQPFFAYYPMALPHKPFVDTPNEKGKDDQTRYEAMVRYIDKLVGDLVATLKANGQLENTMIVFTTDNGSPKDIKLRQGKRTIKGGKGQLTDAGTLVPTVISYPGLIKAGSESNALTDLTDFMPTFAALINQDRPKTHKTDGKNLLPLLSGKIKSHKEYVYLQLADKAAVRDHQFKLYNDGRLYNVISDPLEKNPINTVNSEAAMLASQKLRKAAAKYKTFKN